jgi:hypothetical protein
MRRQIAKLNDRCSCQAASLNVGIGVRIGSTFGEAIGSVLIPKAENAAKDTASSSRAPLQLLDCRLDASPHQRVV